MLGVSLASPEARWGDGSSPSPEVVEGLRSLAREGWRIRLLVFSKWDEALSAELAEEIGTNVHVHPARTPGQLIDAVRACHLVVGERLHSVIFASATFTPAVALEYRPKLADFMRSIGREDLVVRSDRVQQDELVGLVRLVADDRDRYASELQGPVNELRDRLLRQARKIQRIATDTT